MFSSLTVLCCFLLGFWLNGSQEPAPVVGPAPTGTSFSIRQAERGLAIVSAVDVEDLGAAQLEVVFPPGSLEQPQVVAGELLSNALLESNLVSAGRLRIAFVSSEPLRGSGELLKLQFQSPPGSNTPVAWKLENVRGWRSSDSSEVPISLSAPPSSSSPAKPIAEPIPEPKPEARPAAAPEPIRAEPAASEVTLNFPQLPSPLVIRVELPGWTYFVFGCLSMLVIGLLACLLLKKH